MARRSADQPDLFAPAPGAPPADRFGLPRCIAAMEIPPPADFIDKLRRELHATLALVAAASAMPWTDLAQARLAEMRFHSIASGWLPAEESDALRARFETELARLYATLGPPEQYTDADAAWA